MSAPQTGLAKTSQVDAPFICPDCFADVESAEHREECETLDAACGDLSGRPGAPT